MVKLPAFRRVLLSQCSLSFQEKVSDCSVVFKTREECASSAESDSRSNVPRLLEPEEGETKRP
jgi:hypothetical protein